MSKITIKDLYLIFGNDKQHALRMLKEEKSKSVFYISSVLYVRQVKAQPTFSVHTYRLPLPLEVLCINPTCVCFYL